MGEKLSLWILMLCFSTFFLGAQVNAESDLRATQNTEPMTQVDPEDPPEDEGGEETDDPVDEEEQEKDEESDEDSENNEESDEETAANDEENPEGSDEEEQSNEEEPEGNSDDEDVDEVATEDDPTDDPENEGEPSDEENNDQSDDTDQPTFEDFIDQDQVFIDINNDYWAMPNIHYLVSLEIISGYTLENDDKQFFPENNVTRAQAAKMIIEALGESQLEVADATFTDVPTNHWASGYIEKAVQLGVISGYGDKYQPNDTLKRSQMSKIITEAFSLQQTQAQQQIDAVFTDVDANYWASNYISALYYQGISNGSNNQFKPEKAVSRAEFSVFLSRTLNENFRMTVPEPEPEPAPEPDSETGELKGVVTVETTLNVRQSPSTESEVIGKLLNGEIVDVMDLSGNWAHIQFNNETGYVHKTYLKLLSTDKGNMIENRIIVIDAGHGGKDPGTSGYDEQEKNIVLKVAKLVEQRLAELGAHVVMTRDDDTKLELQDRVDIAKENYADIFVSIHANSSTNQDANGTETYYNTSTNENGAESKLLASAIQSEIVKIVGSADRGIKDNELYVVKHNDIPSVLVELGFLSNEVDAELLLDDNVLVKYADGIVSGIQLYYQLF
ncbi:N-acetylmuramoyl-L-alanine amidase [Bacillus sp. SCS-151]|uniref:N-acetylmuramoyl-L-alanine amidase n=1 Tax=Nanhaiella sioensis TaxID=3115293 RepID=UPI003978DAA9